MNLSKNRTGEVFGVDRSTLFGWVRRGCPCIEATKPGLAGQLQFKEVLAWRKADLIRQGWAIDESIAGMEAAVRQRLKLLKKGDRHGTK